MAYFKKKDNMTRTVFSNTFEPPFVDSAKKFYAFVEIGGNDYYMEYQGKFRVEALADFHEQARLSGGKFNGKIYTLKN